MRTKQGTTKDTREEVKKVGYPAYVTSAGWLGYDDDKEHHLTLKALHQGFNHFKMKVGPTLSRTSAAGRSSAPSLVTPLTCLKGKETPESEQHRQKERGACAYD